MDYEYFGDERTVDAHVKKLRQKIEKVGPQVIQTVWVLDISSTIQTLPLMKRKLLLRPKLV